MRVQNKGWDKNESFRVGQEIHTVVGYYTGTNGYHEMFTKVDIEDDLTFYTCWNDTLPMYWTLMETSTLTELDLVCRLFHKGDRGR